MFESNQGGRILAHSALPNNTRRSTIGRGIARKAGFRPKLLPSPRRPPTREELLNVLHKVTKKKGLYALRDPTKKDQEDFVYSHPSLAGREFSPEQVEQAIAIVRQLDKDIYICGDCSYIDLRELLKTCIEADEVDQHFPLCIDELTSVIIALPGDAEFIQATNDQNRKVQMHIVLENILLQILSRNLKERYVGDVDDQAKREFVLSQKMIDEYESRRFSDFGRTEEMDPVINRMRELTLQQPATAIADIAHQVVDELLSGELLIGESLTCMTESQKILTKLAEWEGKQDPEIEWLFSQTEMTPRVAAIRNVSRHLVSYVQGRADPESPEVVDVYKHALKKILSFTDQLRDLVSAPERTKRAVATLQQKYKGLGADKAIIIEAAHEIVELHAHPEITWKLNEILVDVAEFYGPAKQLATLYEMLRHKPKGVRLPTAIEEIDRLLQEDPNKTAVNAAIEYLQSRKPQSEEPFNALTRNAEEFGMRPSSIPEAPPVDIDYDFGVMNFELEADSQEVSEPVVTDEPAVPDRPAILPEPFAADGSIDIQVDDEDLGIFSDTPDDSLATEGLVTDTGMAEIVGLEDQILELGERDEVPLASDLMPAERDLVSAVLGKEECTDADMVAFIEMHSGERELRLRNFIASRWTEGRWRDDIYKYKAAKRSLYRTCRMEIPTKEKRMEALQDTGLLTPNQMEMISFGLGSPIIPASIEEDLERFKNWVSHSDRRFEHWKVGKHDLLALGSLAHKIWTSSLMELTLEEKALASRMLDKNVEALEVDDRKKLHLSFRAVYDDDNLYRKEILSLAGYDEEQQMWIAPETDTRSLLYSAQRHEEFNTLIYFLGIEVPTAYGRLDYSRCATMPRRVKKDGQLEYREVNDDTVTSAVVYLCDGRKIDLGAVFDGVGGNQRGDIASNIAKEVFEIAAIAGWIRDPEDVRRMIITAHMAITLGQIILKKENDFERETDMATTAVFYFVEGDKFYGIHAGDSDYIVIREGEAVHRSRGHTFGNMMAGILAELDPKIAVNVTSALGAQLPSIDINNELKGTPFELEEGDILVLMSDGLSVPICEHEVPIILDRNMGDEKKALDEMIVTAENRRGKGPHATECQCGEREGKSDDDKSGVISIHGKAA